MSKLIIHEDEANKTSQQINQDALSWKWTIWQRELELEGAHIYVVRF
jgi:hypothetical protein